MHKRSRTAVEDFNFKGNSWSFTTSLLPILVQLLSRGLLRACLSMGIRESDSLWDTRKGILHLDSHKMGEILNPEMLHLVLYIIILYHNLKFYKYLHIPVTVLYNLRLVIGNFPYWSLI